MKHRYTRKPACCRERRRPGVISLIGRLLRSRALRVLALTAALLAGWALVRRYALRPPVPPPDEATLEHVRRVRIVRDTWGVPHVFGERDQDAAFGLAYAHAEDDFPTIQAVLAAARGRLGLAPGRGGLAPAPTRAGTSRSGSRTSCRSCSGSTR